MEIRTKLTKLLGDTAADAVLRETPHGVPIAVFSPTTDETVTSEIAQQLRAMKIDAIGSSEMRGENNANTAAKRAEVKPGAAERGQAVPGAEKERQMLQVPVRDDG